MELLSVNLGQARPIRNAKESGISGIFKEPAQGPVYLGLTGPAGDFVADTENHGGVDQAVYIYGGADYAWWSAELGRDIGPGTFGDNLTIADLESARYNAGDRLHAGPVILEVTAPRIPCATLAARMGDPAFAKRFRAAERPGLYARVLREGFVQAGDPVTVERYAGQTIGIVEVFRDYYIRDLDEATIRRHLAAPIAIRVREAMEERLERLRR